MSSNWPASSSARVLSSTHGTSASPALTAAASRRCPSITRKLPSSPSRVISNGIRTPLPATEAQNSALRSRSSRTFPGWATSWATLMRHAASGPPVAPGGPVLSVSVLMAGVSGMGRVPFHEKRRMVEKCAEAGGKTRPRASASAGVITARSACSAAPTRKWARHQCGVARSKECLSGRSGADDPTRSPFRELGLPVLPASAVRAGEGRARNWAARTGKMFCEAKDL